MTDDEIIAAFRCNGVLRIPARSLSDPDGRSFMVAIGRTISKAERERCARLLDPAVALRALRGATHPKDAVARAILEGAEPPADALLPALTPG